MAQTLESIMEQAASDREAFDLGDSIFMSRGCANSYLITTADGDVMINTNLPHEAPRVHCVGTEVHELGTSSRRWPAGRRSLWRGPRRHASKCDEVG